MSSCTLLSKDPSLVHAGGEEDGRLRDTHQQVGDGQVDDEHVGWRPQTTTPANIKTLQIRGSFNLVDGQSVSVLDPENYGF